MDCEICGKEIGKLRQSVVDGNTLFVCEDCASFGKEKAVEKTEETLQRQAPRNTTPQSTMPQKTIMPPEFRRKEFDLGLEIVDDFGKQVRKAREVKGLTTKELAMKIFEKESLLHRIENQAIKPSDEMIKKLEKQLGIQLKKKIE